MPKRENRQPQRFSKVLRSHQMLLKINQAFLCIVKYLNNFNHPNHLLQETTICQALSTYKEEDTSLSSVPDPSTTSSWEVTPTIPPTDFCSERTKGDVDFPSPLHYAKGIQGAATRSKPSTASRLLAMMDLAQFWLSCLNFSFFFL